MTDDTQKKALDAFVRELAKTDETERARLIARVKMLAADATVEDDFFVPDVTNLRDYLATPIPIPPSLVWPTIAVRGEITTTLGRAGKGKTTMNLNRILKWAAGKPLFDDWKGKDGDTERPFLEPSKPLKTLVIENEGSAGMFHQKMGMMLYKCGNILTDEERDLIRENVLIWGDGGYSGLKLDNDADLDKVRAGVEKWEPDIVFIEPFRGLWKGEENSSTDMAVVIDNIIGMSTDYNCATILSHHERKGGAGEDDLMSAGRGSTVLEGAAACMENFQSAKGGDFREMQWSKARYLQPPTPVRMEYQVEHGWYTHIPESDIEQNIMDALAANDEEPLNKSTLADILDEKPTKLEKPLTKLTKDGRLKRLGSVSSGGGSTGYRYELATAEGGLDF